jgi:GT2 family glycosyltransferase
LLERELLRRGYAFGIGYTHMMSAKRGRPQPTTLRTSFVRTGEAEFSGHVVDVADPHRRFVVELWLDGLPIAVRRADQPPSRKSPEIKGYFHCGYSFIVPKAALANCHLAEARLANTGAAVGARVLLRDVVAAPCAKSAPRGSVQWVGGLRFEGWCWPADDAGPIVMASIDGLVVAQAPALSWTYVGEGDAAEAVRKFALELPDRFADGRARYVRFLDEKGRDIGNEPVPFVAFRNDIFQTPETSQSSTARFLRAEILDRLVPNSIPFTHFTTWKRHWEQPVPASSNIAIAVALIGRDGHQQSLTSLEHQSHRDWTAAALPSNGSALGFDAEDLRIFVEGEAKNCEFIVFAMAGTQFAPDALRRIEQSLSENPESIAIYGDTEIVTDDGRLWPIAFPAFDYERMLEQGFCCHLFALRRQPTLTALRARPSNLYRLFNTLLDTNPSASNIVHIPWPLGVLPPLERKAASEALRASTTAHLRARGYSPNVTVTVGALLPAVRVDRAAGRMTATVAIAVRNNAAKARACIESIWPAIVHAGAKIIVVDNNSSEPAMIEYLDDLQRRTTVLRVAGPYNPARLNNAAAEKAKTKYVCFLSPETEATDKYWLEEMLGRIAEPDVGAVGALLLWPNGVVEHSGIVLGADFAASPAFNDRIEQDPGYTDLLRVAHECSAVTMACLLTRTNDHRAVGGLDGDNFPMYFSDIDYCLKLRARHQRIVMTPHAVLRHGKPPSRQDHRPADRDLPFNRELQTLRNRWATALADDGYYSPLLSLGRAPYSGLAWPPRDLRSRTQVSPRMHSDATDAAGT